MIFRRAREFSARQSLAALLVAKRSLLAGRPAEQRGQLHQPAPWWRHSQQSKQRSNNTGWLSHCLT